MHDPGFRTRAMAERGRVDVVDVSLSFAGRAGLTQALEHVSIHVQPGEFVSIVGPSGCGKSSLLNLIAGFVAPSGGELLLDGRAIAGPGAERGVVFQHYSLFPWLTVLANVEYGLRTRGLSRSERRSRAEAWLERCGLLEFANHYPEQLSGGMRQRVSIVRALANEPRVLLMDEPFAALDAQTRLSMQEILLEIWERTRTSVLFITHDIAEAVFLSDRVYVMSARPGSVTSEMPITLRRPRQHDTSDNAEALGLVQKLRRLLRGEPRDAPSISMNPPSFRGTYE